MYFIHAMIQNDFRSWNFDRIDEYFHTTETRTLPSLEALLGFEYTPDDFEKTVLEPLRENYALENYVLGGDD
jgi:hypothetical protein